MNETDGLRRGGCAILLFVLLFGLTGFAWTLRNGRGVEFGLVFGVVILYGGSCAEVSPSMKLFSHPDASART